MITRLRVKNYKSLKDLDLKLRPLTVFVGANSAGKSNIIDSLMLQTDFTNQGAGAFTSRGGFGDLVWDGDAKRSISFAIEGRLPKAGKGQGAPYSYDLEVAGSAKSHTITNEMFAVKGEEGYRTLLEQDQQGAAAVFSTEGIKYGNLRTGGQQPALRTAVSIDQQGIVSEFAEEVSSWTVYTFDLKSMRVPSSARRAVRLSPNGDNLPSVLHTLQTEYPEQFERLKTLIRLVVPEILDLYTPLTEQGSTLVRVKEQGLHMETPLWALSDGTLHTLGLLTALYAPGAPSLMCFEEPENYVHPRVLNVLASTFQEISESNQILITTHSPYLLDLLDPEDLVIVEKRNGATCVTPALRKKGLKPTLNELGLGGAWYSGSIGGVPE